MKPKNKNANDLDIETSFREFYSFACFAFCVVASVRAVVSATGLSVLVWMSLCVFYQLSVHVSFILLYL